ncbi:uncharacterized protein [Haliotis cracherodii]|uniref:uncharacterized protein n=1 Tax=Haliotis cracherodii TaxID=6455 RepID=UPI0039EB1BE1
MFRGTWVVVAVALICCSSTWSLDDIQAGVPPELTRRAIQDAMDERQSDEYRHWLADQVEIQRRAEEAVNLAAAAEEEYERIKYNMKREEDAEDPDAESSSVSAHVSADKRIKRSGQGAPMGKSNRFCDDAQHGLKYDWDPDDPANAINYTCNSQQLDPKHQTFKVHCEHPHKPIHRCMHTPLHKYSDPPISGDHRPLWAKYGEYTFLPWQRWLHNLEHGAIAFLYHKCADPVEVNKTRQMLVNCLRKHIITPYALPEDKPFALVSWGCILRMTHFDETKVFGFIRQHGLHGRENSVTLDGQYSKLLTVPAKLVSTYDDVDICPSSNFPELRYVAAAEHATKKQMLGLTETTRIQRHRNASLAENAHKSQRHKKASVLSTEAKTKAKRSTDFVASEQKLAEGDSSNNMRMLEKREAGWLREEPSQVENEARLLEGDEREAEVARLERGLDKVKRLFRSNVKPFLNN